MGARFFYAKPRDVERGQEDQRKDGRNRETAHDREGHWPPEYGGCDRYHAEHRRYRREHDRAETGHRSLDHRVPYLFASGPLGLDLVDQDHRITRNHSEQCQYAENGNESERPVEDEE